MLPDAMIRFPGTDWGSLIDSFPPARKVYDDAVLHLLKLEHTQQMLAPYESKLNEFRTCLEAVAGCLFECDDGLVKSLCALGKQTCVAYTGGLQQQTLVWLGRRRKVGSVRADQVGLEAGRVVQASQGSGRLE